MPEHFADLGKRRAVPYHVGREAVPEDVRANVWSWRIQPCSLEGLFQNLAYDLCVGKLHVRHTMPNEQRAGCCDTILPDVIGERFTDIPRKRQAIMQSPLAANEKLAHAPVDIINLDRDDFSRAQPEPGHEKHHCIVAPPKRCIRLDGRDHCFHLLRR